MVNDYRDPIGGAELYINRLIDELVQNGHEVRYFTSTCTKAKYNSPLYNKSILKYIIRIFNPISLLRLWRIIDNFQPDIIHLHGIFNELSPSVILACRHIPIVMTVHDVQIFSAVSDQTERRGKKCRNEQCIGCSNCVGFKGMVYEHIRFLIRKLIFKRINRYIAICSYIGDGIRHKYHTDNVTTIYNGIYLSESKPITSWNNLLYIGRITKDKGIYDLIDIFRSLRDTSPLHLTIIGNGPEAKSLRYLLKNQKLNKFITYLGYTEHNKISSYYMNTTAIITPSRYPEIPTVIQEAINYTRPIIASRIGGFSEIITKQIGLLCDFSNPIEAAISIDNFFKNKHNLSVISNNMRNIKSVYSMSINASKIIQIYNQIV